MCLGGRQGSRKAEATGTESVEGRYLFINMVAHSLAMAKVSEIAHMVSKITSNHRKKRSFMEI